MITKTFPQIEPTSTERVLSCMALAIDETKLVRSIIKSRDMASKLKKDNMFTQRFSYLNQEITHLESKLVLVRNKADKTSKKPHLSTS
jgi:hypothetical protein